LYGNYATDSLVSCRNGIGALDKAQVLRQIGRLLRCVSMCRRRGADPCAVGYVESTDHRVAIPAGYRVSVKARIRILVVLLLCCRLRRCIRAARSECGLRGALEPKPLPCFGRCRHGIPQLAQDPHDFAHLLGIRRGKATAFQIQAVLQADARVAS